jgi:coenzyme F420-reducing hydrogenase beta subunit
MCQILELQEDSEKLVVETVKTKGLKDFLNEFEELEITDIEKESIAALKVVIETKEQEIAMREGAEGEVN